MKDGRRERSTGWLVVVGDESERKKWGGGEEIERGKRQIKNKKIPYFNMLSVFCFKFCVYLSLLF